MPFKLEWEKANEQYNLGPEIIKQMVSIACPTYILETFEIINGGCANLNVILTLNLDNYPTMLILRIYIRDKDAAFREQKLGTLLSPTVPVPKIYYIDDYKQYRFAIMEYMPGIPLRDLLISNQANNTLAIMFEVGSLLGNISAHKFTNAGMLDRNLDVIPMTLENGYLVYVKNCLANDAVLQYLGTEMVALIKGLFEKFVEFFPTETERHLVHADYDPANILVDKIDGVWRVSAILDWEFSFSGSTLCDVANMLRYAHQMPAEYQDGFLQGLVSNGVILPSSWRVTVDLLNLFSLLDCLARSEPIRSPKKCADIIALIKSITQRLQTTGL